MIQARELAKLFDLIRDVKICMLTTVDEEGFLRSRPMATQHDYKKDAILWFFTKKRSGKVEEIQGNGMVNLAYASPSEQHYVSVSGHASFVTDKRKMKELWKPYYKAWFPDGLDDPTLGLLRVDVEKAEYWDSSSSFVVHLIGFTKAMLTGEAYQPGENRKLDSSMH